VRAGLGRGGTIICWADAARCGSRSVLYDVYCLVVIKSL